MKNIKPFFAIILLCASLQASGPYTLTNLECANVFVKSNSNVFDKEDIGKIKAILAKVIEVSKLQTNQRDCSTLMVKLDAIHAKPNYYIYTKLALGEEVITHRKDKSETFSLTYDSSDFTQSENPKVDVLESVQYLADEFIEHYKNDNE
ncbi:hypothetical protein KKG72_01140 [bacterium]|nr:hypothetical protein [bacterium]MBU1994908.1 hypothetical protein [bacterium]